MTKNETRALVFMLMGAYPMRNMNTDTQRMQLMLWHEALRDHDAKIVNRIVKEWIFHEKFYPSISEIREIVIAEERRARQALTSAEQEVALWEAVVSGQIALRDMSDAKRKLEKAREDLRRAKEYASEHGYQIGNGTGSSLEAPAATAGAAEDAARK